MIQENFIFLIYIFLFKQSCYRGYNIINIFGYIWINIYLKNYYIHFEKRSVFLAFRELIRLAFHSSSGTFFAQSGVAVAGSVKRAIKLFIVFDLASSKMISSHSSSTFFAKKSVESTK